MTDKNQISWTTEKRMIVKKLYNDYIEVNDPKLDQKTDSGILLATDEASQVFVVVTGSSEFLKGDEIVAMADSTVSVKIGGYRRYFVRKTDIIAEL